MRFLIGVCLALVFLAIAKAVGDKLKWHPLLSWLVGSSAAIVASVPFDLMLEYLRHLKSSK